MAVVRTYCCNDCGTQFDKLHFDRSEPAPECPVCSRAPQGDAPRVRPTRIPAGFAIKSDRSRAVDITQDIMEKDLGMSNFKDNLREGDTAVITPPALQPAIQGFFKPTGDIMAAAKMGAQAAKSENRNPVTMIQRSAKSRGSARVICNPVNSVR